MNCAQALTIAAAGLVLAGEPIRAPLDHFERLFEVSAAKGEALSREALHAVAAVLQTEPRRPEAVFVYASTRSEDACDGTHEPTTHKTREEPAPRPARIEFNIPDASIHAAMRAPV